MWLEEISRVSIYLASLAAAVASIDFFLSEKARRKIDDISVGLWYRVSSIHLKSKIEMYRDRVFFDFVFIYGLAFSTIISGLFETVGYMISGMIPDAVFSLVGAAIVALVSWIICRFMRRTPIYRFTKFFHYWALSAEYLFSVLLRSSLLVFGPIAVVCLMAYLTPFAFQESEILGICLSVVTIALFAGVIITSLVGLFDNMLFTRALLDSAILIPLLVAELFMRRIAEFKKGAVLGVSALLVALSAVMNFVFN